ncbi:mannosyltransferase [Apophysomyces sp. BC1015]|nr:mannosyltransferase [Apophysomyces sp. BC1015]
MRWFRWLSWATLADRRVCGTMLSHWPMLDVLWTSLATQAKTNPGSRIATNRRIRIRRIREAWSVPEGFPKIVYLLWAPVKAVFAALQMIWIMGCITQCPNFILVQNPPAIPTLIIARGIALMRQAWLVIDWHNFGYSILGVKLGAQHPVVRFSKWYEQRFGSKAYAHLTVTDRMRKELAAWGVEGKMITFKDQPQAHFKRLPIDKIHRFLLTCRLQDIVKHDTLDADTFLGRIADNATLLTQITDGNIVLRPDRPRLIVSSTSWTEDEDFSILLRAVEEYEKRAEEGYPNLLFVITGKGPLKSMYEQKISSMKLVKTRIITAWLEAHEYPLLLGSADLGISLHTSSSGMDLPMKVVDMFGCGLPVCAVSFECLDELVTDNRNGLVFNTSEQLANQLVDLFVTEPERLSELRTNVIAEYTEKTWEKQHKDMLSELFGN